MYGLVIAMVLIAFVDVGVEYYLSDSIRINEIIIMILGFIYLLL
jgi:hypothetical protein